MYSKAKIGYRGLLYGWDFHILRISTPIICQKKKEKNKGEKFEVFRTCTPKLLIQQAKLWEWKFSNQQEVELLTPLYHSCTASLTRKVPLCSVGLMKIPSDLQGRVFSDGGCLHIRRLSRGSLHENSPSQSQRNLRTLILQWGTFLPTQQRSSAKTAERWAGLLYPCWFEDFHHHNLAWRLVNNL